MYTTAPYDEHDKYAADHDHHHVHIPNPVPAASGLNTPSLAGTYAPPYIFTVQSNYVRAGGTGPLVFAIVVMILQIVSEIYKHYS